MLREIQGGGAGSGGGTLPSDRGRQLSGTQPISGDGGGSGGGGGGGVSGGKP